MTQSPSLAEDVPCLGCGYNLRALEPGGLCPECGGSIADAIQADVDRRSIAPVPFTDRQVILELLEGTILAIASLLIGIGIIFMPLSAFELKTRARVVMLGVMVTAFVVPWFAAWKLSAPEGDRHFEARRSARRILRASITGLLIAGAIALPLSSITNSDAFKLSAVIIFVILETIAALMYYPHVGQTLRRLGSKTLPILCYILAPINALLLFVSFLPQVDAGESSIATMYRESTVQFGSLEWMNEIFLGFRWNNDVGFSTILGVAWLVCVVSIHIRLLILAMRANRALKDAGQFVPLVRLY